MNNNAQPQYVMLGTTGMLSGLDGIAAARDLAQLEQMGRQAHLISVWLEHETGVAPASAGRDQRPAMEVSWTAALVLQAVSKSRDSAGSKQ
jgi:hypothetical protein